MSYEVKNGQLQPKAVQVSMTAQQMSAIVLLQRRIADLNGDVAMLTSLACAPLAAAVEQATVVMSKSHDAFIVELQRAVKLATEADVPGLALVKP